MAKMSYLHFSDEDMIDAKICFEQKRWNLCGRLCEQVVEKRFKYFLEKRGEEVDFPLMRLHKPHILYRRICVIVGTDIDHRIYATLADLADYYFDTNYPQDNNIIINEQMATDAINCATEIIKWIDSFFTSKLDLF